MEGSYRTEASASFKLSEVYIGPLIRLWCMMLARRTFLDFRNLGFGPFCHSTHRTGQRFSNTRPLNLLAALSTGNYVIPVHRRLKTVPLHIPYPPHLIFLLPRLPQKPLSTYYHPVPKWIRLKSAARPLLAPGRARTGYNRNGQPNNPLDTHLTPSSHPRPQLSSLLVDAMLQLTFSFDAPLEINRVSSQRHPSLSQTSPVRCHGSSLTTRQQH
jgi:hypothetical protein